MAKLSAEIQDAQEILNKHKAESNVRDGIRAYISELLRNTPFGHNV